MPGEFEDLVVRVRDHYLEQFWAFVEEQKARWPESASELKIQSNGGSSGIYKNLYCMDFVKKENGEIGFVELSPERFLRFDPVTFDCGRATLLVDHLRWYDVVIEHDAPDVPADAIEAWFEHWFDPDDAAMRQTEIIHSLALTPGEISIDMGTAPPDALYEMLGLLERAGARSLRLTAGTAEPEA
jgi:hypothetical protein